MTDGLHYDSVVWRPSVCRPGVRFAVRRISLGRRLEAAREIRALGERLEFWRAGEDAGDRAEASISSAEIDLVYLRRGLAAIEGLTIDGATAAADSVVAEGPEDLAREILAAIKAEWGLSEEARKN